MMKKNLSDLVPVLGLFGANARATAEYNSTSEKLNNKEISVDEFDSSCFRNRMYMLLVMAYNFGLAVGAYTAVQHLR